MSHSWRSGLVTLLLVCAVGVFAARAAETESKPQEAMSPQDFNKFVGWFDFFQKRNSQKYAVTGANHIDEAAYVKIGGIEQWVTIRGQDRNNPVLLILHGGPGDVTNPWGYAYFHDWEKYFTVVQWDQRGAGRTLEKSGESIAPTMTIDRMTQDGVEVSEYLQKHLNKEKIGLVGHSWGSVLGLLMAKAKPGLFYAFIGTGQVSSSSKEVNLVAYKLAVQWAESAKNAEAVADLKRIGPPPYANGTGGWGVLYKWRVVLTRLRQTTRAKPKSKITKVRKCMLYTRSHRECGPGFGQWNMFTNPSLRGSFQLRLKEIVFSQHRLLHSFAGAGRPAKTAPGSTGMRCTELTGFASRYRSLTTRGRGQAPTHSSPPAAIF